MSSTRFADALTPVTRVRGLRGAMVVDAADGLVVEEALMEDVDGRAVAALAAALMLRLVRTARAAGHRPPVFLHLRGTEGALLAVPAPGELLVVAVADPAANIGLARLELLDAAARLG